MCSKFAIEVSNLSKCYSIYNKPFDRLKQILFSDTLKSINRRDKKYHTEFWALKNISLNISKGEVVGVIGRNGSGKSTLLQIICNTLSATTGSIKVHGRVAALLELGTGFNPEFSGKENIYLNAAILGLSSSETKARYQQIVEFAEIGQFIDQPVKTYSSGMVIRLAFAVAINVDPDILIIDEALSVGDELFQRKCFSKIESIRSNGSTILFVSHSGGTIVELCDRAILLDAGECIATGSPKLVVGEYHRLLYASSSNREIERERIKKSNYEITTEGATITNVIQADIDNIEGNLNATYLREHYDPSLVPSTTITYESHGVNLLVEGIFTKENLRVNNLIGGRKYYYRYRVVFDCTVTNVRFGMMIKTISGVELGGGVTAATPRDSISTVLKNSKMTVNFEFQCNLNTGTYFLNSGVLGCVDETEIYLHRIVDAAMFKVLPEADNLTTGIVDFHCTPIAAETIC